MPSRRTKKIIQEEEKKAVFSPDSFPTEPGDKIRFSYSKITTWLHCHLRWKYSYIDRLVPKKKGAALQIGDITHKLLDLWNKGELKAEHLRDLESYVQTLYPSNEGEESIDIAREAARLVVGYIRQYEDDPLKVVSSEVHIQQEMPDYYLYARVDGLARTADNRLWRLEYKTAKRMDSFYLNGLKASLQGAIYDYVIEETFKEKLSGTIYSMLIKTNVPQFPRAFSPVSRPRIARMHETCQGVLRDIQRGDFYPSSACFNYGRDCDFKVLCDSDSQENREAFFTLRPQDAEPVEEKKDEE